jgi:hypothetical protein
MRHAIQRCTRQLQFGTVRIGLIFAPAFQAAPTPILPRGELSPASVAIANSVARTLNPIAQRGLSANILKRESKKGKNSRDL